MVVATKPRPGSIGKCNQTARYHFLLILPGMTNCADGQTKDERAAVSWIRERQDKTVYQVNASSVQRFSNGECCGATPRGRGVAPRSWYARHHLTAIEEPMIQLHSAQETPQVLTELKGTFHTENTRPTSRTKFWRLFLSFSSFSPEAIHCDGRGGKGGIHYIRLNQLTWDGGTEEGTNGDREKERVDSVGKLSDHREMKKKKRRKGKSKRRRRRRHC